LRFNAGQLERDRQAAVQRPRLSDEMNQQCAVCEGLAQDGKTGVSTTLNAVLEPCAGKARMHGSSGAALPGGSAATLYKLLGFPAAARATLKSGKQRCSKLQSQRGDGIRHMALLTQGRPGAGSLRVRKTLRRVTDELEFFFEPPGVQ